MYPGKSRQWNDYLPPPPPTPTDLSKYTDLLKCLSCDQSVCILLKMHFDRLQYVFNAYI